jgi:hypothetical protein
VGGRTGKTLKSSGRSQGQIAVLRRQVNAILRTLHGAASRLTDHKYKQLAQYEIASGYRRIYLHHVHKTAGTSLNHMFLSLGGENPAEVYARLARQGWVIRRTISNKYVYVGWDARLIQAGQYFYAFSHIPSHALRLPPGTFTITSLRDPRKRVMSLYREYLDYKVNNIQHRCRAYSDAWLGNSFGDFLGNIPKTELMQQIYMFSKRLSVEEAVDNILGCSMVLRTEQFDEGCQQLARRLNLPLGPALHMRRATIAVDFSRAELAALDTRLEPEYRLLEQLDSTARRVPGF